MARRPFHDSRHESHQRFRPHTTPCSTRCTQGKGISRCWGGAGGPRRRAPGTAGPGPCGGRHRSEPRPPARFPSAAHVASRMHAQSSDGQMVSGRLRGIARRDAPGRVAPLLIFPYRRPTFKALTTASLDWARGACKILSASLMNAWFCWGGMAAAEALFLLRVMGGAASCSKPPGKGASCKGSRLSCSLSPACHE